MDDACRALLAVAFRHSVEEAHADAGYARVRTLAGIALGRDEFEVALAACLRRGLLRDPVDLAEGALHCSWRLRLTPAGVTVARSQAGSSGGNQSPSTCSSS